MCILNRDYCVIPVNSSELDCGDQVRLCCSFGVVLSVILIVSHFVIACAHNEQLILGMSKRVTHHEYLIFAIVETILLVSLALCPRCRRRREQQRSNLYNCGRHVYVPDADGGGRTNLCSCGRPAYVPKAEAG